jgi:hypothetical protein
MPYIVTEIIDGGGVVPASISGRFSFSIHKNGMDLHPFTITYAKREDAVEGRDAALKMIKNAVST